MKRNFGIGPIQRLKNDSVYFVDMGFRGEPLILSSGTTKYLQPLKVYFFQDYKYFLKEIAKYS